MCLHATCAYLCTVCVDYILIQYEQIERKLMAYLKRVEDVLGQDWDKQAEGQKLKEEGEAFKRKLNTQDLFEEWKLKVLYMHVMK